MTSTKFHWVNKETEKFLKNGYIPQDMTVEERVKEICDTSEQIYGAGTLGNFSERLYNYASKGWVSFSSPVWANFGKRGLPISCFGSYIEDNMESILYTNAEIGMMTKQGGGTSVYLNNIRPRGSEISTGGKADGPVHFAGITSSIIEKCKQSDVRRGACAVYLDITHPDLPELLRIGQEGAEIQNLQYGVCVSDDFLNKVEDGDKEARKIWASVLRNRIKVGFPYIFFSDNANNNAPNYYKGKIKATNLCVSGDTQILTNFGYQSIADLSGESVDIWNGEEWSAVDVFKTGINQKLLRVSTNSGYELDCTEYHKFYVQRGYSKGTGSAKLEIVEKRAFELLPGDKLIKFDLPIINGSKDLPYAYDNGFFSGDGCYSPQGSRIYLYHEKRDLLTFINSVENWTNQPDQKRIYGHTNKLKDKFFVPDSEFTIKSRLEWLAGYLDADGTITNNNGSQSIQVSSTEKEFLKEVQLMLQTLGCDSKVVKGVEEGERFLPKNDGTGEVGLYLCKETHRLLINGNSLYKLSQLGFKCNRLKWEVKRPNRECSQFIKIESVVELDGLHDTYCFTEPKRHMGMFNGILTGQCTEIMLPSDENESFVCCLSSVNLLYFDDWKDDADFIQDMIFFLDSVLEEFIQKSSGIKFMERAHNFAKNHRALGLGVLGWHSYLQSKMIPIESLQAQALNKIIFKGIRDKSEIATEMLASFYRPLNTTLGKKAYNTTLLAVAPTKSSSYILGQVSQGIEPIKSNYFIKDLAKVKEVYKNPILEKFLESKGLNNKQIWSSILSKDGSVQHLEELTQDEKDVFKTAMEISQLELVRQNADRQKFVDQGISFNLFIHPDIPFKEINKLYIEAWKLGLKSLYYQISENSAQAFARDLNQCVSCES